MFFRFVFYGLLGWVLEVFWTGLESGLGGDPRLRSTTYLWMFPIYGLAVFLEPVHQHIRHWPWLLRGIIWLVIIWAIEYVTGGLLRMFTGYSPWDYTGVGRWEINGLIRLDMAPLWFAAGLLFEKTHDFIKKITARL
ncbi:MAG: membrane protein [Peptococcaceae bacterium BRH_c4b]|nr:MAG: membrane protein [Peptococcaceae bacterium BRH_c4b]